MGSISRGSPPRPEVTAVVSPGIPRAFAATEHFSFQISLAVQTMPNSFECLASFAYSSSLQQHVARYVTRYAMLLFARLSSSRDRVKIQEHRPIERKRKRHALNRSHRTSAALGKNWKSAEKLARALDDSLSARDTSRYSLPFSGIADSSRCSDSRGRAGMRGATTGLITNGS